MGLWSYRFAFEVEADKVVVEVRDTVIAGEVDGVVAADLR